MILLTSTLYTPLLKVPILLSTTILGYAATGAPPKAAHVPQELKVAKPDFIAHTLTIQYVFTRSTMGAYCALALVESAVILAQTFPGSTIADAILSIFAPGGQTLSLRMTPAFLAGSALTFAGAAFRLQTRRILGEHFTGQLSIKKGHRLVTSGPYAVVRHPSYTGAAMPKVGSALALLATSGSYFAQMPQAPGWAAPVKATMLAAAGYWILVYLVGVPRRIMHEEAMLREEFGEEWEAFERKTPCRIIPFIW